MRHFKEMKVIYMVIIAFFTLCTIANVKGDRDQKSERQTIKVMTYNLKYASPTFKPAWSVRRDWQVDLIKKYGPDIIGTQEGLKEQVDFLMDHLTEYVVI